MSDLPRCYNKRVIKPENILSAMQFYYPAATDLYSYTLLLYKDLREYVAQKHRASFRKDKEYEEIVPRIRLGVKIFASCDKFVRVADIYEKLEANRTRLAGYSFKRWMNDLTLLDDKLFAKAVIAAPDVFSSWLTNYKHTLSELSSLAKHIARAGNVDSFNRFRELVLSAGYDVTSVDEVLVPINHGVFYTDDETPGKHEVTFGLIKYFYEVRPTSEQPEPEPVEVQLHEPDPAQIATIVAQHKEQRLTNLATKIRNAAQTVSGLYPHEIAALSVCRYWTSEGAVGYPTVEFAIRLAGIDNFLPYMEDLKKRGYLTDSNTQALLTHFTVAELSAYLKDHNLKCSGKKAILIERIITNIEDSKIHKDFPGKYFSLTEKGQSVLDQYPFVSEMEKSGSHDHRWCGPRADLWHIFETIEKPEGLSLLDVANVFGIKFYEQDATQYESSYSVGDDWPGETVTFEAPDGSTVNCAISAFCDRDYTPYDFRGECQEAMHRELFQYLQKNK